MAVVRTAGTEIIRSAFFEDVDSAEQRLIYGVQHHIYTVLNVIFYCTARAGTESIWMTALGYDSRGGTTGENHYLCAINCAEQETYVWNDKFSFNGTEPVDFAGPMDDATKQDAIADQGSSTVQYLRCGTSSVNTKYDVTVTYIDQNNS